VSVVEGIVLAADVSPSRLRWAPEIPVRFVDVDGMRLRYITAGTGPALVLLHTLRTQLDIFERMLPLLAAHFCVYALDYPGHGHSDAPAGRYDAQFFTAAVEGFLDRLDLREVTLAGLSIGGVIPLVLAARRNARVARIVAINPYDYGQGLGLARSSLFGWIVTHVARVPILGEIIIPLAPRWLIRQVLLGGVADASHLPDEFASEIHRAAKRPGQGRAFIHLLRNGRSWQDAQKDYAVVDKPTLLIWSDQDWSDPSERARTAGLIHGVKRESISDGGHFLSLDQPDALSRLIIGFARDRRD
jgi:pimeloyl-ACP methyl ester carboxylesterase